MGLFVRLTVDGVEGGGVCSTKDDIGLSGSARPAAVIQRFLGCFT